MARVPRKCQRCGDAYTGNRIYCSPECRAAAEVSQALAPRLFTVVFMCEGPADPKTGALLTETVLLQYRAHPRDSEEIVIQAEADLRLLIPAHVAYRFHDIKMECHGIKPGTHAEYPTARLIHRVQDL